MKTYLPVDETIYQLPPIARNVNRYWNAVADARAIAAARDYQTELNPAPRNIVVWLDAGIATVPLYGPVNVASLSAPTCEHCLRQPCACRAAVRRINEDPILSGELTPDELNRWRDAHEGPGYR